MKLSTASAGATMPVRPRSIDAKALGVGRLPADYRLNATIRLILAASGFLVIALVPPESHPRTDLTYAALVAHTLYAALLYTLGFARTRAGNFVHDWGHWFDLVWYTVLVTLSSGTNSIFYVGFFFPILVASFRWGFASGMRVTVVATFLFTTLGLAVAPPPPEFHYQRFFIRPIALLALGYMLASRGRLELGLRQRLQFLKDVGIVSNPRFGVDRTVGILMHRLCKLYDAAACAVIVKDPASGHWLFRRTRRGGEEAPIAAESIPDEVATRFLSFPDKLAVAYCAPDGLRAWSSEVDRSTIWERDAALPEVTVEVCEAVAVGLDAGSFIAVPVTGRSPESGWLYLAFRERRMPDDSDVAFLIQVVDHAFPLIENIRLVDHLAASAAHEERRRIALDIHDSVIQPFVGLHMGLVALRQRLHAKDHPAEADLQRLVEMAAAGLQDLRKEVTAVRGGGSRGDLVPAVSRFAAKFSDATGITVRVDAANDFAVNERVAGETFQMVAEGLSNIRRHTQSTSATVSLACRGGCLVIQVENEGLLDEPPRPFTPRSITERALALGGRVDVAARGDGGARVTVEIPL